MMQQSPQHDRPTRAVHVVGLVAVLLFSTVVAASADPMPGAPGPVADPRGATHQVHLGGSRTGLDSPAGIALDAAGNVYVGDVHDDAINVYAAGTTGNSAPARVITSDHLSGPYSLDFLPNGDLVVCSYYSGSVLVLPAGANGPTRPKRTIAGPATNLVYPRGCATDEAGNIYVAEQHHDALLVFGPRANGNATPARGYLGGLTGLTEVLDLDVDDAGNIYALNGYGLSTVRVFEPTTGTTSPPDRVVDVGYVSPSSVAVDSGGAIYVGDGSYDTSLDPAAPDPVNGPLYVYPPGSTGAEVETVIQPRWSTGATYLDGIAFDAANNIWLAGRRNDPMSNPSDGPGDVFRFRAVYPATGAGPGRPSAVRKLRVVTAPGARSHTVSWKAPRVRGSGKLTYRITITAGRKKTVTRSSTRTRLRVSAKELAKNLGRAGRATRRYQVTVRPANRVGPGPAASTTFRAR